MRTTPHPHSSILSTGTIRGSLVITPDGIPVGTVQELIIDPIDMSVAFAIVDFGVVSPGFPSQVLPEQQLPEQQLSEQRIALPIELLDADTENHRFVLRVPPSPFADSFTSEDLDDALEQESAEALSFRIRNQSQWN